MGFSRSALVLGVAVWMLAAPANGADATVSLKDGRATVILHDATIRQALAEWARVGQTRIVNLEKVPGGPVTLELTDVPEIKALQVLLRSVAGYIVAPRPPGGAGASRFDRILILPTSVAAPASPMRAPVAPAMFSPPDPTALANGEASDDQAQPAPTFVFPANGGQAATEQVPGMQPPVQPYTPPTLAPPAAPQTPPVAPIPGQYTTSQPGIIPVPTQTPQSPQPPPQ